MACYTSCNSTSQCCAQIKCCLGTNMPRTLTWQKISHFTGLPLDTATLTWNGTRCQWDGTSVGGKYICFGCTQTPNDVWTIGNTSDADGCCTIVECTTP